jgi:fatty-acyl-CoA synthase
MPDLHSSLTNAVQFSRRAATEVRALSHLRRAGVIGGDPPIQTVKGLRLSAQYGQLASAVMLSAQRYGDKPGLIDELGTLTFSELDARSNALACALRDRGLRERDSIGILCRNHRGLIDCCC